MEDGCCSDWSMAGRVRPSWSFCLARVMGFCPQACLSSLQSKSCIFQFHRLTHWYLRRHFLFLHLFLLQKKTLANPPPYPQIFFQQLGLHDMPMLNQSLVAGIACDDWLWLINIRLLKMPVWQHVRGWISPVNWRLWAWKEERGGRLVVG